MKQQIRQMMNHRCCKQFLIPLTLIATSISIHGYDFIFKDLNKAHQSSQSWYHPKQINLSKSQHRWKPTGIVVPASCLLLRSISNQKWWSSVFSLTKSHKHTRHTRKIGPGCPKQLCGLGLRCHLSIPPRKCCSTWSYLTVGLGLHLRTQNSIKLHSRYI